MLRGERVRVRGLQSCGEEVGAVLGPARVAVNLRGVEVSEVSRGDALLATAWPALVSVVDCHLRGVGGPVPQRLPRELTLHVGTAAVAVRTQLRAPHEVRLRLASPLPLAPGDRAVLRDPGRHEVLAGVEVLVVDPPRRRRSSRPARTGGGSSATRGAGPAHARGAETAYRRPAGVVDLLAWLAEHPLQAPTRDQLDRWDLDASDLALAAEDGAILRIGGVVLAGDAPARAETTVRQLAQPFTVGQAARAMATSRRVAVPLLERLDAALVTRRRPDGSRELR